MKYENYIAEDFFGDENFRNWILANDPGLNFFWEKWIMHNPEKRQEIELARKLVLTLKLKDEQITDKQKEEIWKKIQAENRHHGQATRNESKILSINEELSPKSSKRSFGWYFYRSAAAILLIVTTWLLLKEPTLVEQQDILRSTVEKQNPSGQKSKIYLSDGTVVHLNASSGISYLEDFEPDKRMIHLSGEAYFEVARDSIRPLIVVSGSLKTKALGTKFNVSAFPGEKEITISLLEGKVEVIDTVENQKLVLEEHQAATYTLENSRLDRTPFNHSKSILWKDGILYFQKLPLNEVIVELERWYGVKIIISGASDTPKSVSGRFENESLANVLQSIAFSSDFIFSINGKEVIIQF